MLLKIAGETHHLWRAIVHEGEVLEAYVTKTRDKAAALNFLRKAMKRYGTTSLLTTTNPLLLVPNTPSLK